MLSPGNRFVIIEVDNCKIGIGICYDIRFSELSRIYRKQGMQLTNTEEFLSKIKIKYNCVLGCDVLLFPGAFNMKTGPLHWELLGRARANDNQTFVGLISPSRDASAGYIAWGHSMMIDPWGKVLQSAKEGDEIIVQDIGKFIIVG